MSMKRNAEENEEEKNEKKRKSFVIQWNLLKYDYFFSQMQFSERIPTLNYLNYSKLDSYYSNNEKKTVSMNRIYIIIKWHTPAISQRFRMCPSCYVTSSFLSIVAYLEADPI